MSNVFYAENDQQPPSTFSVVETSNDIKSGDNLTPDESKWLFEDDASLGSQLFGMAIIQNALKAGKNLLLILNPMDKSDIK